MSERDVGAVPGPKFTRGETGVLFAFVVDSNSIVGPRPATAADQAEHAEAWASFCRAEGVEPMDRDANGAAGGSLPAAAPEPARRGGRRGAR